MTIAAEEDAVAAPARPIVATSVRSMRHGRLHPAMAHAKEHVSPPVKLLVIPLQKLQEAAAIVLQVVPVAVPLLVALIALEIAKPVVKEVA